MIWLLLPLGLLVTGQFWSATRPAREHTALAISVPLALLLWLWLYASLSLSIKPDLQPLLLLAAGLGFEALRRTCEPRTPNGAAFLAAAANLSLLAAFVFRSLLGYTTLPLAVVLLLLLPVLWRASQSAPVAAQRAQAISAVLLLVAAAMPFIHRNWLPELGIPASLGVFLAAVADLRPATEQPTRRGWLALRQIGLYVITLAAALHFLQFR